MKDMRIFIAWVAVLQDLFSVSETTAIELIPWAKNLLKPNEGRKK